MHLCSCVLILCVGACIVSLGLAAVENVAQQGLMDGDSPWGQLMTICPGTMDARMVVPPAFGQNRGANAHSLNGGKCQ